MTNDRQKWRWSKAATARECEKNNSLSKFAHHRSCSSDIHHLTIRLNPIYYYFSDRIAFVVSIADVFGFQRIFFLKFNQTFHDVLHSIAVHTPIKCKLLLMIADCKAWYWLFDAIIPYGAYKMYETNKKKWRTADILKISACFGASIQSYYSFSPIPCSNWVSLVFFLLSVSSTLVPSCDWHG